MSFKPVTQRHDRVIIILGGESLCGFDFNLVPDRVPVITCNFVMDYLPFNVDYWVSIDTGAPMSWFPTRPKGPYYFYGVPQIAPPGAHALRRCARGPLREDKSEIVTGSSGYAALNLAYHFEAQKIAVLGLDGAGGHFYDRSEPLIEEGHRDPVWYHDSFPDLFAMGEEQLRGRVMNGSPNSRVTCFPRCTPEEAIKWVME